MGSRMVDVVREGVLGVRESMEDDQLVIPR